MSTDCAGAGIFSEVDIPAKIVQLSTERIELPAIGFGAAPDTIVDDDCRGRVIEIDTQ